MGSFPLFESRFTSLGDPRGYRVAGLLGQLKLNWSLRSSLYDHRPQNDSTALSDVTNWASPDIPVYARKVNWRNPPDMRWLPLLLAFPAACTLADTLEGKVMRTVSG